MYLLYCILRLSIKDKNSIVSTIKCQVCSALWLTNTVQLVCGKQSHCYSFPCKYMDSYHFIHGFTKLSTTLNGYCLQLHNICLAMHSLLHTRSMGRFSLAM